MTVGELATALEFDVLNMGDGGKVVTNGYACDLLSWVIGRAEPGSAFITIMTNINVVAVAMLADAACVILCEGVEPDANAMQKASDEGVNILRAKKSAFETSYKVYRAIGGDNI